jgi:phosphatidylglycerophosphatase A
LLVLVGQTHILSWIAVALFVVGIVSCHVFLVCQHSDTNPDPGYIIIDEVCGMFACVSVLEQRIAGEWPSSVHLTLCVAVFVLFRIFDIWKPLGIKKVEKLCAQKTKLIALGIMIDDILAASLAGIVAFLGFTLWAPSMFFANNL